MITGTLYAIFRVAEKKYYSLKDIRGYQRHAERIIDTPNADYTISNERLIGTRDITNNAKNYIDGCKLRKDNVFGRELLFTTSQAFMKNLNEEGKKIWIDLNLKFIKDNFGDNCIYAVAHKDETTLHISAFIIPKFYDEKTQIYKLSNKTYFDGKKKMSEWQDKYHSAMHESFKDLHRGIKYSQAKHVQIRTYYALINARLNESDLQSVISKASNSIILEKQVRSLQKTLNLYSEIFENKQKNEKSLSKFNHNLESDLKNIKTDNKIYAETIKAMSELYKISQRDINKIITTIENNIEKEKTIDIKVKVEEEERVLKL